MQVPIDPGLIRSAWEHADRRFPEECCGLILSHSIAPMRNAHPDPQNAFRIEPKAYTKLIRCDAVQAIYHSHCNGNRDFSIPDTNGCRAGGVPWLLLPINPDRTHAPIQYFDPRITAPYLERPYRSGIWDCYSLVKDWYAQELKTSLPEFDRLGDLEHTTPGWDRFQRELQAFGFKRQSQTQRGDILLYAIRSDHVNHMGVMISPDRYLHHLYGRLSTESVYAPSKALHSIWRMQ